jgi:hypothetical protein
MGTNIYSAVRFSKDFKPQFNNVRIPVALPWLILKFTHYMTTSGRRLILKEY